MKIFLPHTLNSRQIYQIGILEDKALVMPTFSFQDIGTKQSIPFCALEPSRQPKVSGNLRLVEILQ